VAERFLRAGGATGANFHCMLCDRFRIISRRRSYKKEQALDHRVFAGAVCAACLLGAAEPARAHALFNFDGYALNTQVAPSLTLGAAGGLQATFMDSASPITCDPIPGECGYLVRDPLETEVVNGVTQYRFDFTFTQHLVALGFGRDALEIDFNRRVSYFTAPFALRFPDSLDATFLLDGNEIAAANYSAAVPPGHEFEEGVVSYYGALFNSVILQTPITTYYPNGQGNPPTIVNHVSLTLGEVEVPEPATATLLLAAMAGMGLRRRR
jgi:hypothetical protein